MTDTRLVVVATGPQGPPGPEGQIGPSGIGTWAGEYNPQTPYPAKSIVLAADGSAYVTLVDVASGVVPPNAPWEIMVRAGVHTVANRSGDVTLDASDIGRFDAQVRTTTLDQMSPPQASVSFNGQRATLLGDSIGSQDAVNKRTLDAATASLVPTAVIGQPNGVASLDNVGKLLVTQLPPLAVNDFLGNVATQVAMLALVGQRGDWCVRTDFDPQRAYRLISDDPTQLANWVQTGSDSLVNTVAGKTGDITLVQGDVANLTADLSAKAAKAANLSDLADPATALVNVGIGTGATRFGPPGATPLWRDLFQRDDGPLVNDYADTGQMYVGGAGTNDPYIVGGTYAGPPSDLPGHISSFLTPAPLDEIPTFMYVDVSFDMSYGVNGLQRAVFVGNPPAGTRSVVGVTVGNPTILQTAAGHGLRDGQKVTFNNSYTGIVGLNGLQALVTVIDDTHVSVPLATTGVYVGTDGKITTGLANQSFQAYFDPHGYGFFRYDTIQNYILQADFPTPLFQLGKGVVRYRVGFMVDLANHTARLWLPQVGIVKVTDSYINPVYWGSQPSIQRDIPVGSGNVYVHEVTASGTAHKPPVVQSQPRYAHFKGDPKSWLETIVPSSWTPLDIDLIAWVNPDVVASGTTRTILSIWGTGAAKRTFHWSLDGTGKLQLQVSIDGQNALPVATSSSPIPAGGCWVRVTRVAGSAAITFSYSQAPFVGTNRRVVPWSLISSTVGTAGAPFQPTTEHFQFGNRDTSPATPMAGTIGYVALLDGISGTPIVEIDQRRAWNGLDLVGNRWAMSPLATVGGGLEWLLPKENVSGLTTDLAAKLSASWALPAALRLSGDGSHLTTPAPAWTPGVLAFISLLVPDHWGSAGVQPIIGQYAAAGLRSFWFGLATNGQPELSLSFDGTNFTPANSGQATGFVDGQFGAIRADFDPVAGTVQFYISVDGIAWVANGTPQSVTAQTIAVVTEPWWIGSRDPSGPSFAGTIIAALVFNGGFGGTLVGGIDLRLPFNGIDAAGNVWTPLGTGITPQVLSSEMVASPSFKGVTTTVAQAHGVVSQTVNAGAYTIDASTGDVQLVNLTGNAGAATIVNPTIGQILFLEWKQDATGGRTYSLPASIVLLRTWIAKTAPNARDNVMVRWNGANWIEVSRGQSAMATVFATPANPTQTASTAMVMAGIGVTFTPTGTGKVHIVVSGTLGTGTAVSNCSVAGRYGTGSAPGNGAADIGTAFDQGTIEVKSAVATSGYGVPFTTMQVVQLIPGTTYWVDLAFLTATAADQARLFNLAVTVSELVA